MSENTQIKFKRSYRIELADTLQGHYYSIWLKNAEGRERFIGHYISVTTILQAYPFSEYLQKFIGDKGWHESRAIRDEAGRKGTRIHAGIEMLLNGENLTREPNYTTEEWFKIKSFVDWYNEYHPEIIATELNIFSKKGKYAGRVDCVAKINGEITVLDWKSSKSIHESFPLQFAAYANAIEENTDLKIIQTAALQLGAQNKNGYRFVVYPDWKDHYKVFENVRKVWQYDYLDSKKNPKEPPVLELPSTLKLEVKK